MVMVACVLRVLIVACVLKVVMVACVLRVVTVSRNAWHSLTHGKEGGRNSIDVRGTVIQQLGTF